MEIQFGLTVRFYYDKERTYFQKRLFSNGVAKKVRYECNSNAISNACELHRRYWLTRFNKV